VSTVKNLLALGFVFVVVTGLALLSIVWTVISFGRGEYLTTVVVLGFALSFVGLEASLALVLLGKVRPRVKFDDKGTTIRPDRAADSLLKWGTVAVAIAVATYAIFAPQGKIDIPVPYGNQRMWAIVAIGITVAGIVSLWRTFKRGGVGFIRLTTSGFEMSQGSSSMDGVWDDVVAITDRRPDKPPPLRAMIFVKFRDDRVRTLVVDSYTPGGDAMRRFVRYYWLNSDHRAELTDGRAMERLSDFEAKS
jgi:hypothetical protein